MSQAQWREEVWQFGQDDHLTGVLCRPEWLDVEQPAVVFVSAGLEHKVGPRGIHRYLARQLAEQGYSSLRFDYAGIGDSQKPKTVRRENRGLRPAVVDIKQAIDAVATKTGIERFIVLGLCSGADDAHFAAVADERITGVILIDGYGFRTRQYYLHYYLERIFSVRRWMNILRRIFTPKKPAVGDDEIVLDDLYFREMPSKQQAIKDLTLLAQRNVRILHVFTGDVREYYSYENQYLDMFDHADFVKTMTVKFWPQTDHVFSQLVQRKALLEECGRWLGEGGFVISSSSDAVDHQSDSDH